LPLYITSWYLFKRANFALCFILALRCSRHSHCSRHSRHPRHSQFCVVRGGHRPRGRRPASATCGRVATRIEANITHALGRRPVGADHVGRVARWIEADIAGRSIGPPARRVRGDMDRGGHRPCARPATRQRDAWARGDTDRGGHRPCGQRPVSAPRGRVATWIEADRGPPARRVGAWRPDRDGHRPRARPATSRKSQRRSHHATSPTDLHRSICQGGTTFSAGNARKSGRFSKTIYLHAGR
jgi:hypothetical protein